MPEVKKYRPNIGAPRTTPNEEPAAERACYFRPVDTGFTKEDAIAEANRCLDCKKPLCMQGCPVGVNIPGFISKIRDEDWAGAHRHVRMLPRRGGRRDQVRLRRRPRLRRQRRRLGRPGRTSGQLPR